jgi:hypothetical protein
MWKGSHSYKLGCQAVSDWMRPPHLFCGDLPYAYVSVIDAYYWSAYKSVVFNVDFDVHIATKAACDRDMYSFCDLTICARLVV